MIKSKIKITLGDITIGPTDPDELEATTWAYHLTEKGYRKISNAYCCIGRIDREDWLDVLANERRCCRADFYNLDGTGIADSHRDYYIRVYSKDKHTVSPKVYSLMKRYT